MAVQLFLKFSKLPYQIHHPYATINPPNHPKKYTQLPHSSPLQLQHLHAPNPPLFPSNKSKINIPLARCQGWLAARLSRTDLHLSLPKIWLKFSLSYGYQDEWFRQNCSLIRPYNSNNNNSPDNEKASCATPPPPPSPLSRRNINFVLVLSHREWVSPCGDQRS